MPYFEHTELTTPPPDTVIWRYMDVLQFLTMLEQHALYFALLREVDDVWEAALSKRLNATLIGSAPDMPARYHRLSKHVAINCWHENQSESVAMWSLYTSEGNGIVIQSTVGRLTESFKSNARMVHIGRVIYEDHDKDYEEPYPDSGLNMLRAVFQKRECYRHESELRAIIHVMDELPPDAVPPFVIPPPAHGIPFNVDLNLLIQRVVVSSSFPRWGQRVLKAAMKKAELSLDIEDSAMLQQPSVSLE
jgi:hypothetical protein